MTYGTVTDQYYYVEGEEGLVELVYTGVDITDDCSDEFKHTTSNFEDGKMKPIMNRVLEKYYSMVNKE